MSRKLLILGALLLAGCGRSAEPEPPAAPAVVVQPLPNAPKIPAQPLPAVKSRWAIVPAGTLAHSGFADLLLVELTKSGLSLVERERLDAALKEQSLAGLMDARSGQKRVELGKLLAAEGLVLMSEVKTGSGVHLKIVLCDGRQGARLRTEYLPLPAGQADQQARELTPKLLGLLAETDRHFAVGLRRVLAVPPFISEDLAHDHAHLQLGLAELLANTLGREAGTAIIEMEEAQSLATDVWLAAGVERVVPLTVQGSFRTTPVSQGAEAVLRIKADVANGTKVLSAISKEGLPVSQAGAWVRDDLAGQILKAAGGQAAGGLSIKEQFTAMVGRADAFAQLGYWTESTGLREAALLLQDDPRQRQLVMGEYCHLLRLPFGADGSSSDRGSQDQPEDPRVIQAIQKLVPPGWRLEDCRPGDPKWERVIAPRAEMCIRWWGHLRHLMEHDQVRGIEHLVQDQGNHRGYPPSESMGRVEQAKFQMIRSTWERLAAQAGDVKGLSRYQRRVDELCHLMTWVNYDGRPVHNERLAAMYRLLGDLLIDTAPPAAPPPTHAIYLLIQPGGAIIDPQKLVYDPSNWKTHPAFLELCARLEASRRPDYVCLARLGRLHIDVRHRGYHSQPRPIREVHADLERLLVDYLAIPNASKRSELYQSAHRLWLELDKPLNPGKYTSAPGPPPGELANVPVTMGELKFDRLDLQIRQRDGLTVPLSKGTAFFDLKDTRRFPLNRPMRFLQCKPGLACFWHPGQVLLWRKAGRLEDVLHDAGRTIEEVVWDDRWLWVSSLDRRVTILDETGKEVTKIGKDDGLPPCNLALYLQPLAPGKVLAVGSFGEPPRSWLAVIEHTEGKSRIDVIQEMTLLRLPQQKVADWVRDTKAAFRAAWVLPYQEDRPDAPRLLLINRALDPENYTGPVLPLAVNLQSLAVSLHSAPLFGPQLAWKGQVFSVAHGSTLAQYAAPGKQWTQADLAPSVEPHKVDPLVRPCCMIKYRGMIPQHLLYSRVLPIDGHIYAIGGTWYRLDPVTLKEHWLVPGMLPEPYRACHGAGVHSTFGLIVWNPWTFENIYRVTLPPVSKAE